MRTLYIDCRMGAAGDMLTAALLELQQDKAAALRRLNSIGLDGVSVSAQPCVRCGLAGTVVDVSVNGEVEGAAHDHDSGHGTHHHTITTLHWKRSRRKSPHSMRQNR